MPRDKKTEAKRGIGATVLPRGLPPVAGLELQLNFLVVVGHVAVRTERVWSEEFADEAEI